LQKVGNLKDANFPKDVEGRVYHLGVKRGEVANRILSVGDPKRADLIASLLDEPVKNFVWPSPRGFIIYTGLKNGTPITVIATGMGLPMMDFLVRESRAVVDGTMAILRLGTCGTPKADINVGTLTIASGGSILVRRDPDSFLPESEGKLPYYAFSKPILPDAKLSKILCEKMKSNLTSSSVVEGLNATADSFYSSQGRVDPNFHDHNNTLIDEVVAKYPETVSIEMETFQLFDLATNSHSTIKASAATIVLAQRRSGEFLDNETIKKLEKEAGIACLLALIEYPLSREDVMDDDQCVWKHRL